VIQPIARVLEVFHLPVIVIALVIASFSAHWWLYAPHGLMAGLEDAIATPGGLLFIVALTLLAGCFHEFGHASALQYGGGQVSSMGVGLYLVYPVFYTDVTDGYRLSRWARIRTDLGGIYFHLIFAAALILAARLFHRELLLLAVVLIDIDIVRQFIPFVKLDGYWMIADLTGIPDLFSQMSPFLRGVSHTRSENVASSAELKGWVKIVLAVYILLTIPVLAYLFILLIRTLPTIVMTAVDAFYMQSTMVVAAWQQGAFATVFLILITAFFILVPVIGSFYTIYAFGRSPSIRLWKWSKPVMVRQIGFVACVAAFLTLAAFSWMPQFRTAWESSRAGQASKAAALIDQARQATAQVSTLHADVEGSLGDVGFTGTLTLKRPNLARLEIKSNGGLGDFLIVSDGKKLFTYFPHDNHYIASIPGAKGEYIDGVVLDQMQQFFQPETIAEGRSQSYAPQVNTEIVKGKQYDVVVQASPHPPRRIFRYYISPQDRMVHRVVTIGDEPRKGKRIPVSWTQLNNLQLNAPLDESVFHWTLPSGASPSQLPNDLLPLGKLLGGS
jgi:outer membrane lipoprotein-sorting protein